MYIEVMGDPGRDDRSKHYLLSAWWPKPGARHYRYEIDRGQKSVAKSKYVYHSQLAALTAGLELISLMEEQERT